VNHIDAALRDFHSLQAMAGKTTPLSKIDPRAKILATFGFIVIAVSFDRYAVAALLPLALFPVLMAAVGRISMGFVLRKVLIASPFAVMVGLFNPWLDQQTMALFFGVPVSGGWLSFASILIRFALTASAALILVASTGLLPLCIALQRLGVPSPFANQLLFLQRYASVLVGEASRMRLARKLRSGGRPRLPLSVWASLMGHLLLRALQRAQRIHQAMLSRGFDSVLRLGQAPRWRTADTLFLLCCWGSFALVRQVDGPNLLGRLLLGVVS